MMSYLWILLIGSLLATSAKAQDDAAPTEEAAEPAAPAPETDAPETVVEPETDIGTEDTSPAAPQLDAAPEAVAEDPAAPAEEDAATDGPSDHGADAAAAAEESVPVEADGGDAADPSAADPPAAAETDAPAAEETETDAPAAEETETHTAAADGDQASETATADPKVEPAPASEPDSLGADNAETEQSTSDTPKEESDTDDQAPPATDITEPNKEEEATGPAAHDDTSEPDVEGKDKPEVKIDDVVDVPIIKQAAAPEVKEDGGFDLADALGGGDSAVVDPPQPGKSRSFGSDGVSAGAAGSADNNQPKEGGSGSLAGILSGIVLSAVGAVTGYFAYQKKKLCFKNRQEADPEAAHKANAAEADPQVSSNLLS